jgi:DNA-binding beta-propeller fold protein YncE
MTPTLARLALIAAVAGSVAPATAQLALSANDGKQPELGEPPTHIRPDNVAVIDFGRYPPRVIGKVDVPVSMIGPPTIVAVAPGSDFAIVTNGQKLDPADPTKFILDSRVSVIDLADPSRPKVIQSLEAGAGASGVSINGAGTLALVAATGDGTVTIFAITGKSLTRVGAVQLDPKPGPVDVLIAPDGKTALVTQRRGNAVWRLAIDGTKVTDTGISYTTGGNPYGSVIGRDGRYAYNTNLLGKLPLLPPPALGRALPPRIGTVSVIDLKADKIVNTIDAGPTPEHVALSPDGKYLAVTVVNGSSSKPGSANYNPFGFLKIYRVRGPSLTLVAQARTGRWGQGATWSDDGKTILQQAAVAREIEVYRFNGRTLARDTGATLKFDTRPGAISTARSR